MPNKDEDVFKSNDTKRVGAIGIAGNVFLFIIKIIMSLVSHSQAMFADSINSATDIFSSLMTYIGGKISGEPSDEGHNYGHGKAEYIYSLLISVVTIYLGLKIAIDGVISLFSGTVIEFSIWLIVVCIVTIIIKFVLYKYVKKIGDKNNNILILANAQDHINDVLVTFSVLVGILASIFHIYWLDGAVAVIIAIRICYAGFKIFVDSYTVLMDPAMKEGELQIIYDLIKAHGEIDHIDKVTSKAVGSKFIVIVKISVDGNMAVKDSHKIAGILRSEILLLDNVYDVVIHVNPV